MSFKNFLEGNGGFSSLFNRSKDQTSKLQELSCNAAPPLSAEIPLSTEAHKLLANFTQILEANYEATGKKISQEFLQAKQQELRRMLFLWQENVFIIDQTGFSIAQKLSEQLNAAFRVKDIEIPLFGSLTTGGALIRRIFHASFTTPLKSDFDCGLIVSEKTITGKISQEIRYQTSKLLGVLKSPYLLCHSAHPNEEKIRSINTLAEAQKMLLDYFCNPKVPPINNRGTLYFFPTFPLEKWEKNMSLIRSAFRSFDQKTQKRIFTMVSRALECGYNIGTKHLTYNGEELRSFASNGQYGKLIQNTESDLRSYIDTQHKRLLREVLFGGKPLPYVVL
mgnify:CR=1 FL=1